MSDLPSLNDDAQSDTLITRSGITLSRGDIKWKLSQDITLNWELLPSLPQHIVVACKAHIAYQAANFADHYVYNTFQSIIRIFRVTQDSISHDLESDIGYDLFSTAKIKLKPDFSTSTLASDLGAYRRWYIWCTDAGLPGFDLDVASRLEQTYISQAGKARAVLGHDPESGPLTNVEFTALTSRLRVAEPGDLALQEIVLTWLFVCFGLNPKAARLIEEQDFVKTQLDDGSVAYALRIPRIKKRHERDRAQFRTRMLDRRLGALIEELIAVNEEARTKDLTRADPIYSRPLISSGRPHKRPGRR